MALLPSLSEGQPNAKLCCKLLNGDTTLINGSSGKVHLEYEKEWYYLSQQTHMSVPWSLPYVIKVQKQMQYLRCILPQFQKCLEGP